MSTGRGVEVTQEIRRQEVERVLEHSSLDPFGLLQVSRQCSTDDVKAAYRSKSRLIHPDKTAHDKARDAFEKLKKAETQLMDDEQRKRVLGLMAEARRELSATWQQEVASGKRRPEDADQASESFEAAALEKYKQIAVDIEWRRRQKLKQHLAAEGAAAAKDEEAVREKRRKRAADKAWEDSRDERVNNWRSFQQTKKKKKKKPKA